MLSFNPLPEFCILIAISLGYGVKNGLILPGTIPVPLFLLYSLFRYAFSYYHIFMAYYYVILAGAG